MVMLLKYKVIMEGYVTVCKKRVLCPVFLWPVICFQWSVFRDRRNRSERARLLGRHFLVRESRKTEKDNCSASRQNGAMHGGVGEELRRVQIEV